MKDAQIVALYWAREEAAIAESERKYGAYCYGIAQRVLANHEDTQETLDDTWLHAWNAMPPQKPPKLRPFFARLTRNLAINRWHRNTAEKRGAGMTLALEELPDLFSKGDEPKRRSRERSWRRRSANSSPTVPRPNGTSFCGAISSLKARKKLRHVTPCGRATYSICCPVPEKS